MKKLAFLFLSLFSITLLYGQKESTIWYFGNRAGLDFSFDNPEVLTDGNLNTLEGCATMSDSNGELLFYTDGVTVWNKLHQVMQNGNDLLGHSSSSQSAVIVKKPNSDTIYFIFTTGSNGVPNGLRYSEVNITENGGEGALTENKNVLLASSSTEKLTVARHANNVDFWVVSHDLGSTFFTYKISDLGVNTTAVISNIGVDHSGTIGCMKVSPNRERLAIANGIANGSNQDETIVQVFDFNANTGFINNPVSISTFFTVELGGVYGVEFSPNSKLLYVTELDVIDSSSRLHQFNVSLNSQNEIVNSDVILFSDSHLMSSIQLALNDKIYIANVHRNTLNIINKPNNIGAAADYSHEGLDLGPRMSLSGLPQFSGGYLPLNIEVDNVCLGDTSSFSVDFDGAIDSILWDFNDGSTSTLENPNHMYSSGGVYNVMVTLISGSFSKTVTIETIVIDLSSLDTVDDYELCDDVSNDGIEIFDLSLQDSLIFQNLPNAESYNLTYHVTLAEAESGLNALNNFYENITTEQELYYRVEDSSNAFCYGVSSFFIRVVTPFEFGDTTTDFFTINIIDWSGYNNSIQIIINDGNQYVYSLDGVSYQETPIFENLNAGEYVVHIKDVLRCGIVKKEVFLLDYLPFFTPNGDGKHDFWQIKFSEKELNLVVYIFDRYGKLITGIKAGAKGWDGTFKGKPMPQSDYWFLVERPNQGKEYRGHFTLKR